MSARRSFQEIFSHFKSLGYQPSAVIDVGAADGTPALYEAYPDVTHYAFEPLPKFCEKLKDRMSHLDHHIFQCGVMDKPGRTSLFLHDDPYGSSFMHPAPPEGRQLDIEVKTLDDALAGYPIGDSALLKTDCQGADLYAIRGGTEVLKHCEVVIMEASFFPFWGPREPVFDEIIHEMCGRGFKVYDLLDGLFRPYDNALGQVDVVFVREHGCLRTSNSW